MSRRFDIPLSTVNSRLKEARKRLREEFANMFASLTNDFVLWFTSFTDGFALRVAASGIQEKSAPDNFVQNVMERVASLPTPVPKGNIVERIGRTLCKNLLPATGMELMMKHKVFFQVATLVAFLSFSQISQAQIAFVSERDWNKEIYVMDADGNNPRNLTNHPAPDYQSDWFNAGYPVSPAGKLRAIWGWLKQNSE